MTPKTSQNTIPKAETPSGLNHVVLNVRDLDRAHRFWTEYLGFRHVATARDSSLRMRFYSGENGGALRHHDIALLEQPAMPAEVPRDAQVFNHVAITYPTLESWQRQIRFLAAHGIIAEEVTERGATYSADIYDPDGNEIELVCERPRELWEADIDGAINSARPIA